MRIRSDGCTKNIFWKHLILFKLRPIPLLMPQGYTEESLKEISLFVSFFNCPFFCMHPLVW